jgi:hypothetical protein
LSTTSPSGWSNPAKRPGRRHGVILQHDNARPHTANMTGRFFHIRNNKIVNVLCYVIYCILFNCVVVGGSFNTTQYITKMCERTDKTTIYIYIYTDTNK